MRTKWLVALAAILLCSLSSVAQECSLQSIVGTYAIRYTGESFLGDMPFPPGTAPTASALPVHSPGLYAYGVIVGVMTIKPDATMNIRYWSTIGSWSSMRTGVSMAGSIKSIGLERTAGGVELGCVGLAEYAPFENAPPHRDRFFVLDNGREIRSMPFDTPAFPTVATMGVARRITRAGDPAPRCGAQTARGSYLLSCPGPLFNPSGEVKTVGSMAFIHLKLQENGVMTGVLHNRSANVYTPVQVDGGLVVNPDCTGEAWFVAPEFVPGAVLKSMFVFTSEGRDGFALPLELYYPAANLTVPYPPVSCEIQRITPN